MRVENLSVSPQRALAVQGPILEHGVHGREGCFDLRGNGPQGLLVRRGRIDLVQRGGEAGGVGQARLSGLQRGVLLMQVRDELLTFHLGLPAGGNILFDGDKVADRIVLVQHGRDRHLLRVQTAILATVHELTVPDVPRRDGLPELTIERLALSAALEQARAAPDDLVGGISRQPGAGRVHPRDGPLPVGHQDRVRRGLQGLAL